MLEHDEEGRAAEKAGAVTRCSPGTSVGAVGKPLTTDIGKGAALAGPAHTRREISPVFAGKLTEAT